MKDLLSKFVYIYIITFFNLLNNFIKPFLNDAKKQKGTYKPTKDKLG